MQGELPFYKDGSERGDRAVKSVRYAGVFMTRKGPRSFVTRTREAAPEKALEIQETAGDAQALADELLKKYDPLMRNSAVLVEAQTAEESSIIGQVGVHSDGDALHTAICVGMEGEECMLLFLTSHPSWNPYARPIKKDEAPFTGFRWNPTTFLAPVLRNPRDLHWRNRCLPTHRVEALREEFFKPERMALISQL